MEFKLIRLCLWTKGTSANTALMGSSSSSLFPSTAREREEGSSQEQQEARAVTLGSTKAFPGWAHPLPPDPDFASFTFTWLGLASQALYKLLGDRIQATFSSDSEHLSSLGRRENVARTISNGLAFYEIRYSKIRLLGYWEKNSPCIPSLHYSMKSMSFTLLERRRGSTQLKDVNPTWAGGKWLRLSCGLSVGGLIPAAMCR